MLAEARRCRPFSKVRLWYLAKGRSRCPAARVLALAIDLGRPLVQ